MQALRGQAEAWRCAVRRKPGAARSLYQLAGEINAPILALSQVSRGVETRQDKRPMMSDLSQSGILDLLHKSHKPWLC